MKSYTDIEQSRKLAKILPLESADMWYVNGEGKPLSGYWNEASHDYDDIPCWSLAALLNIIAQQDFIIKDIENEFNIDIPIRHCKIWFPSLLDAAFEMVVWLKENNKL